MRAPFLAGLLAGLLCALVALAIVVASLQPLTISPGPAGSTAGAGGSTGPSSSASPGSSAVAGGSGAPGSGPGGSGASGSPGSGSTASAGTATTPPVGIQVGDRAPQLKVAALGGGSIDLAASRGKPVWVSFTASWCPSCRDELGLMNSFRAQLGDGLAMIVVDVKEDQDTVASLVAATNIQAPVGLDRDGAVSAAWEVNVLPVHYWVDAQGIVRGVLYGAAPPEAFIRGIRTVLPSASLSP